jgi:hypothetical protein
MAIHRIFMGRAPDGHRITAERLNGRVKQYQQLALFHRTIRFPKKSIR